MITRKTMFIMFTMFIKQYSVLKVYGIPIQITDNSSNNKQLIRIKCLCCGKECLACEQDRNKIY